MGDELYTVAEISKIIKTNVAYVYELIKAGLLPVLKLGSFKIRKESLLKFLEKYEGYDLTNPHDPKKLEEWDSGVNESINEKGEGNKQ